MADETKNSTGQNSDSSDDERFTVREEAQFLGVSERRVHQLRRRGELASVRARRFPARYEFRASELMAYVERAAARMTPPLAPGNPESVPEQTPPRPQTTTEEMGEIMRHFQPNEAERTEVVVESQPLVRLVNAIFVNAIEARASEIHFEPDRKNLRIRCRIDGSLRELMAIPKHVQTAVFNRLKVMADLPQYTHASRQPQSGIIPIRFRNNDYCLRVSCVRTIHSESFVARIYAQPPLALSKCGLYAELQNEWEQMCARPGGLLVVAGPGGSGKTTTAYATLNRLNSVERKIVSLEDLRGYELAGIDQMYLSGLPEVSYPSAVYAALRLCPDVLFLGGINTPERAQCALNAAQSGPLVLATMEASNAQTALSRLESWGVARAHLRGLLAQVLARRVCASCPETYAANPQEQTYLYRLGATGQGSTAPLFLQRGKGCESCRDTGYKERLPVYELLRFGKNDSNPTVWSREQDAAQKVGDGVFTVQEIAALL